MKNVLRCLPLLLVVAACQDETLTDYIVKDAPELPVKATWNASLAPGDPTAPQASATLQLREFGSYMLLELSAQGLPPDSTYEWRMYFGPCDAQVAKYGPDANPPAYPMFTASSGGTGTSVATVAGRLKADSTYSMRVFIPRPRPSPVDTAIYACGNLQRTGN